MTLNYIHIFIVTGSFLYWCVMRPASQRFFIYSCIYLRILIISYLTTFLGTNSLYCADVPQSSQSINQFWFVCISYKSVVFSFLLVFFPWVEFPWVFPCHLELTYLNDELSGVSWQPLFRYTFFLATEGLDSRCLHHIFDFLPLLFYAFLLLCSVCCLPPLWF